MLRRATPKRLSTFSDGVFAVLITGRHAGARTRATGSRAYLRVSTGPPGQERPGLLVLDLRRELWLKPPNLRLERGFDRPVRRLNGDHARPGIGDTASLADVLDLRTLLREFTSAQD